MDTNEFEFDFEKEYGFDPNIMNLEAHDVDFNDALFTEEDAQLDFQRGTPA